MRLINIFPLILIIGYAPVFQTRAQEPDATRLFKILEPSVVLITDEEGGGSGVVISADGLILTNYHVVNTPLTIQVEAIVEEGGKTVKKSFPNATVTKVHASNDLALLKVTAPNVQFKPAKLSKSSADTKTGDTCYALGYPFVVDQEKPVITITKGIISSAKRVINEVPYIQLDAAINPGNSGGALINSKGVLIGIPTLRFEGSDSIGMASPVAEIKLDQFVDPKNRKGNPAEALRLSNIASALYTSDAFSLNTDDEAVAVAIYLQRQALALEPNNTKWSLSLAAMYWRMQKYPLVRAYAENAVRLDPNNLRARLLLANAHSALKEPAKAAQQRIDCLPLLSEKTEADVKKNLFDTLATELSASGELVKAVYIVSWGLAQNGGIAGPGQRLVLQNAERSVPESLTREIMDKKSGHSIEDMKDYARKAGELANIDKPQQPVIPAKLTDEPKKPTTEVVAVSFKSGYTATMADAPPGVVYNPDKSVLEWTPPPFSSKSEVQVLFALKDANGKEEFQVHTIRRK